LGPHVGNRVVLLNRNRLRLYVQALCVARKAITEARLRTGKLQNELGDPAVSKDLDSEVFAMHANILHSDDRIAHIVHVQHVVHIDLKHGSQLC